MVEEGIFSITIGFSSFSTLLKTDGMNGLALLRKRETFLTFWLLFLNTEFGLTGYVAENF